MDTQAVIYSWTPVNVDTAMETVPNSVTTSVYSQNVELQNCRNSLRDTAQFFCGRFFRSRILILLAVLLLFTLCGAFVFHLIESSAELANLNQTRNRMREKRNELQDRIAAVHKSRDHDSKALANLTYASLLWYENELKQKTKSEAVPDGSYSEKMLLIGASFSTVGFQLQGPSTAPARSAYALLVVPGIFLYLHCAYTIGEVLLNFYNGVFHCFCMACCFCRVRRNRRNRNDNVEYWLAGVSCANLLPYGIVLLVLFLVETVIFYNTRAHPGSRVDSIFCVALSIFTIGFKRSSQGGASETALLLIYSFIWLAHLACFWHAFGRQRVVFKKYLFAWLYKNKEDALFIKLSLLQPMGRRPALADRLMSRCTQGSLYRRLLFCTLTLDDKVDMCRYLTWRPESKIAAKSVHTSPNGEGQYNACVQVDLDRDHL